MLYDISEAAEIGITTEEEPKEVFDRDATLVGKYTAMWNGNNAGSQYNTLIMPEEGYFYGEDPSVSRQDYVVTSSGFTVGMETPVGASLSNFVRKGTSREGTSGIWY